MTGWGLLKRPFKTGLPLTQCLRPLPHTQLKALPETPSGHFTLNPVTLPKSTGTLWVLHVRHFQSHGIKAPRLENSSSDKQPNLFLQ